MTALVTIDEVTNREVSPLSPLPPTFPFSPPPNPQPGLQPSDLLLRHFGDFADPVPSLLKELCTEVHFFFSFSLLLSTSFSLCPFLYPYVSASPFSLFNQITPSFTFFTLTLSPSHSLTFSPSHLLIRSPSHSLRRHKYTLTIRGRVSSPALPFLTASRSLGGLSFFPSPPPSFVPSFHQWFVLYLILRSADRGLLPMLHGHETHELIEDGFVMAEVLTHAGVKDVGGT